MWGELCRRYCEGQVGSGRVGKVVVKRRVDSFLPLLSRGVRLIGQMSLPSSLIELQNIITAKALRKNHNGSIHARIPICWYCLHSPYFPPPWEAAGRWPGCLCLGKVFVGCSQSHWLRFEL